MIPSFAPCFLRNLSIEKAAKIQMKQSVLPEHGNTTAATRSQGDETFHLSGGENSRPIHPDSVLPILEGSQPRS